MNGDEWRLTGGRTSVKFFWGVVWIRGVIDDLNPLLSVSGLTWLCLRRPWTRSSIGPKIDSRVFEGKRKMF